MYIRADFFLKVIKNCKNCKISFSIRKMKLFSAFVGLTSAVHDQALPNSIYICEGEESLNGKYHKVHKVNFSKHFIK